MSNPNPVQTPEFVAKQFKPVSDLPDEPLAKKAVALKLPESVHEYLMQMERGDRINLMRQAITAEVERRKQAE